MGLYQAIKEAYREDRDLFSALTVAGAAVSVVAAFLAPPILSRYLEERNELRASANEADAVFIADRSAFHPTFYGNNNGILDCEEVKSMADDLDNAPEPFQLSDCTRVPEKERSVDYFFTRRDLEQYVDKYRKQLQDYDRVLEFNGKPRRR